MKNMPEFDYLKQLEAASEQYIPSDTNLIARLDGRAFHTFTRGLKRPFDATLRETMADTTKALMQKFGASEAFTQSDEITLIWRVRENRNSTGLVEHPFSGRTVKLGTLLSSFCTLEFYKLIHHYKSTSYNGFDCRIYGGDDKVADDSLRFRFIDAAANAYQSVAQSLWSQKQLNGVSVQQIKAKLKDEAKIDPFKEFGEEAMLGVWFFREEVKVQREGCTTFGPITMSIKTGKTKIVRSNGAEMMKSINKKLDI